MNVNGTELTVEDIRECVRQLKSAKPLFPSRLPIFHQEEIQQLRSTEISPSASRVAEVLIRQQDPNNWSDEVWEAYEQDMQEFRDAVKREQKEHSEDRENRQQGPRNV